MKKVKIVGLGLFVIGLLGFTAYLVFKFVNPKGAALLVETSPLSTVFIDGEQVGKTPYEARQKSGEITVKLVPDSFEKPLIPFETKVTLVTGIKTVVRRNIGESDEASSGEVISFEKAENDNAEMVVISNPDAINVNLDGTIRGITPLKLTSVSPGKHKLTLTFAGFSDLSFNIETVKGYRLTAAIKLAVSGNPTPTPEPETTLVKNQLMVEILGTPTGFLRVRKDPTTLADEVGRVKPGEKYKLIKIDDKSGWFQIEFQPAKDGKDAITGWVTNLYTKKLDANMTPTPTLSPKVTLTPTPTP